MSRWSSAEIRTWSSGRDIVVSSCESIRVRRRRAPRRARRCARRRVPSTPPRISRSCSPRLGPGECSFAGALGEAHARALEPHLAEVHVRERARSVRGARAADPRADRARPAPDAGLHARGLEPLGERVARRTPRVHSAIRASSSAWCCEPRRRASRSARRAPTPERPSRATSALPLGVGRTRDRDPAVLAARTDRRRAGAQCSRGCRSGPATSPFAEKRATTSDRLYTAVSICEQSIDSPSPVRRAAPQRAERSRARR